MSGTTGRLGRYTEKQPGLVNGQQRGKTGRTGKNLVAARTANGVKQGLELTVWDLNLTRWVRWDMLE